MTQISERARQLIFARNMRDQLQTALASNSGVVSVSVDGTSVTYGREQAFAEYHKWCKMVQRLSRKSGRFSTFRLDTQG